MFANILLPIDIQHPASWEKALPMAAQLCDADGTLHILGILHEIGMAMLATYLPDDFEAEAVRTLTEDLTEFAKTNVPEGTRWEVHIGHGHVPEQVLANAAKVSADIIVMASHPPDELRMLLVGSFADRVVRHSERPVLVVR